MGSEPGMAWNWCVNLANYCELFIITEGEFRQKIEATIPMLPQGNNMRFYYNPVSEKVRRMCWNQGDWRFYRYYKKWQKSTADIAREICKKEKIDILHQLNMIGFREPGYLWKVSRETGIPFVWGPIDAKDSFPMAYAQKACFKTQLFLIAKNLITRLQLQFGNRVKAAANQASVVIGASSNSINSLKKYLNIDAKLINETGCHITSNSNSEEKQHSNLFNILWVGKFDFRKQLDLALQALASINNKGIRLHIVGGGPDKQYKELAKKLGIFSCCIWHGTISHESVQSIMKQSDLLIFTSVAEGTPHVVLEAIANKLPIICFDTCGQGDCVDKSVGIKIPLTNPEQSVKDFANKIDYLNYHREILVQMSENCPKRAKKLSWNNKAMQMVNLYKEIRHGKN
jgi:glycosyltransferase involved in cell wall biosynthesis